jgi:hypothetical protein
LTRCEFVIVALSKLLSELLMFTRPGPKAKPLNEKPRSEAILRLQTKSQPRPIVTASSEMQEFQRILASYESNGPSYESYGEGSLRNTEIPQTPQTSQNAMVPWNADVPQNSEVSREAPQNPEALQNPEAPQNPEASRNPETTKIRRRQQYTREYRLAALTFYHRTSVPHDGKPALSKYRISRILNITEKMLRDWIKNEDSIRQQPVGTRRNNSGRDASFPEIEDLLDREFRNLRLKGIPVKRSWFLSTARKLYEEKYPDKVITDPITRAKLYISFHS